jgi:hypothetical protein
MAGKDTSYTHKDWKGRMAVINSGLKDKLPGGLRHIEADWQKVGVGRTQRSEMTTWQTEVETVAQMGDRILGNYNVVLTGVGQGQAAAGGLDEVAADKNYNQD